MAASAGLATWNTSGTYRWNPALADHILDAYSRIQIRGPAITPDHIIEARRSSNYILQEYSNRGVNQWQVGDPDIMIALGPGVSEYVIPRNTVNLLDCYLRSYTRGATITRLGVPLTPFVTQSGSPLVSQPWGDPLVLQPGSGTLSCTAGDQEITLRWRAHGIEAGFPIFWNSPISIGGLAIYGFSIVTSVVDEDHVAFLAAEPARETQTNQGGTPLFSTTVGSSIVSVVFPGHGLSAGDPFVVNVPVNVGGLVLAGSYSVSVLSRYEFTFNASPTSVPPRATTVSGAVLTGDDGTVLTGDDGTVLTGDSTTVLIPGTGVATSTDSVFENAGIISVSTQAAGANFQDIFLWPISRNDYAYLPDKQVQGRPTTYWYNRSIQPTIQLWPVPPSQSLAENKTTTLSGTVLTSDDGTILTSDDGTILTSDDGISPQPVAGTSFVTLSLGPFYGFIGYRMRELQDANPLSGQNLETPRRFFAAFVAELCASLAEKFKPEVWESKMKMAMLLWQQASAEDREKVAFEIIPDMSGF